MSDAIDWYESNPWTTRDRRLARHPSAWARGFACDDVRVLIVCRGPIRKEAMDVFAEMGVAAYGILLSEKDSITYSHALAPELRRISSERVHRVKDYTGATKDERVERVAQIIRICQKHGYTHVFAGYGFMSEDADFSGALERAGLVFVGPRSSVQSAAGKKDEAKRTAEREGVSVTPGITDATTRTLLHKHPDLAALRECVSAHGLTVDPARLADGVALASAAEAVLDASYTGRVDLFTIDELGDEIARCAEEMFLANPGHRVRLKAIGGGGGKGQRILAGIPATGGHPRDAAAKAPKAVREILGEVKAGGVGDDKNILLELNVEETRHNEIQLIGNGRWAVALGGRDCSLQMHEQKLLEVSITQEGLARAAATARAEGRTAKADALDTDLVTLRRMEEEAERFAVAVGLNSASTFECIVEGARHFFMEVNTRIQVEHRVTELCYGLRFTNPDDANDHFDVTSLVECMVLLARHGERLPRPSRVPREGAAVEARLNATDGALSPHAGGVIVSWSPPIEHEVRDDQGICVRNPDTGQFMRYRLAGAYDSNVALLVTAGDDRAEAYARLGEILRRSRIRGSDLRTNLEFHDGLVHWFIARDVHARPTTRFVVPYLTLVGQLADEAHGLDLAQLWAGLCAHHEARAKSSGDAETAKSLVAATRKALAPKETLFRRPIEELFREPHHLSGWLSHHRDRYTVTEGRVTWRENPWSVLRDTYWLLAMDWRADEPAATVIWDHDHALLERALGFYARLTERLPLDWPALVARLRDATPPDGFDAGLWGRVRSSHAGFQCGAEMLDVLPLVGARVGFEDLRLRDDLTVEIPARLLDATLQAKMKRVLSPPPEESPDTIVAVTGGMFYAQEAPDRPPFIAQGQRFKAGDPLYMIEVMKMFNTVYARFSGTVEEVLIREADGAVVRRGQPLFRVKPDEAVTHDDPAAQARKARAHTQSYLDAIAR